MIILRHFLKEALTKVMSSSAVLPPSKIRLAGHVPYSTLLNTWKRIRNKSMWKRASVDAYTTPTT